MARAAGQPIILLVADNKVAEASKPVLRAGCELTGAMDPARVVRSPPMTCSRLKTSPPTPTCRNSAPPPLWKLATGAVSILIAPIEAAALRLFERDYYPASPSR